jgi:hypothetical protein
MSVSARALLRVSAIVTFVFAGGHMMGAATSWAGPGGGEVLRAMREVSFEVAGATRSYWHFYFGFGVYIGVLLTLQAVMLWQMGSIGANGIMRIRPMLMAMSAAFAVGTVVLWVYIFIVPALFSLVCTVCIAAALAAARRSS